LEISEGDESSFTTSSLDLKDMVDESVETILEEGIKEFDGKYLRWIQQVFQLQLSKMQTRLTHSFAKKLENMTKAKEIDITEVQQKYREKLQDFETTTEKFQEWIESHEGCCDFRTSRNSG
jgi:hypothetical protein